MKIAVTGADGLLGRHASVRLHAANCAARFKSNADPFDLVRLDRAAFNDPAHLRAAVSGADAVLHFAGVNRAPDEEVEQGNPAIAGALADACREAGSAPHIVYANSTHASGDTPYGRGKHRAGEVLSRASSRFTDLILPHVFGEGARPDYNNVTATFIDRVIRGEIPNVNPDGRVDLLHAGAAAQSAVDAALAGTIGRLLPQPRPTAVPSLLEKLRCFHTSYSANVYPDLSDPFDLALFNSYRAALYPAGFPRALKINADPRGTLFEAVKGGGGGQTFLSWTEPGVTRGNHFHLSKVERFLVLEGEAVIRIRRALGDAVWEYRVSGDAPAAVDMPTMHTHSIENVGAGRLLTLFWTQDLFDPAAPDTYADPVLEA
ncbi:polysaccharide biosynthesis C-terminal domain-containing protein [Hyphomicrobium sp.]|uniref:polysaccharide biosynthesis C-terminal domain-containing protein n=1 Tax=Hyphomicrobium sp. TaxID=82 RepID=UPI003F70E421